MVDPESPQYKAYAWLRGDPDLKRYSAWRREQRFALATFLIASNVESKLRAGFDSCLAFTSCGTSGRIKAITQNKTKQNKTKGFPGFSPSLPPELTLLTDLVEIDVSRNVLSTTSLEDFVLSAASSAPALQVLGCNHCNFGKTTLPTEQLDLHSNLKEFRMEQSNITGTVPSEIGLLTLLKGFSLDRNRLDANLAKEIGRLTQLEFGTI
ncbi:Leucine Rich Repeat [Seminavis robusta]|uniref:Leucine Rich Repeat n=1 Tax=Seminavis robusta TaxID=568900 RepID=A0A9N8DYI3_9STRA|nr:Leucine Rich Repeat [Seminavis robusta]|eukprot:Sro465_g148680.1 Leucine Rich Repeat (209) ;mRNA; f:58294-58920